MSRGGGAIPLSAKKMFFLGGNNALNFMKIIIIIFEYFKKNVHFCSYVCPLRLGGGAKVINGYVH